MKGSQFARLAALIATLSLGFALLGAAAAPRAAAQDGQPVPGGTLRMVLGEEPDQLDPARTIELTANQMLAHMCDGLVYILPDGAPGGLVGESWEISPDNLTITFKIRQGMTFHDGTPVDAPAVKVGYDRIMDPAMAAPQLGFLGPIKAVEAPDATTLVFTYNEPYAPFFNTAATIPIVSPAGVEQFGDEFGRNPVCSGPFKFREWEGGSRIVLERNAEYVNHRQDDANKGAPYVDEIVFNIISEPATRTAAFESGEIDVLDVPSADVARLSETPGITIVAQERGHNINFIEFANRPPYNNASFRKAVAHAVDRDAIIEIAYLGRATANQCPVPIGDPAYDEALCAEHGYAYDLELAKQELAAGGFVDSDGNGVVELDGEDVEVTLWSYSGFDVQQKTIELIQPDLNEIGLGVEIQTVDFGALQPLLESGEAGFDYMRWTYYDQSILSQLFKSPGWLGQTSDPALDELLAVADSTLDPEARLEASRAAMTYVLDNSIIVPIHTDWFQSAVNENVNGYHWDAVDAERLIDVWLTE